jgi:hypothetical protein
MAGDAGDYSTYEKFRVAHRGRQEVRETFAVWDEQIMRIAEREGRRFGFRTDGASQYWDVFLAKVVIPLKSAFWIGWESQICLDQFYAAARKRAIVSGTLQTENQVFPATQVASRVQMPDVDEPGDDAFLLSITESAEGGRSGGKNNDVPVLAASRLLERVQKPEVEELGDEAFLLSVTGDLPSEKKTTSSAPVLEARKLLDRVQQPDVERSGDDGFLLSVTEQGGSTPAPGVLAASRLVGQSAEPMRGIPDISEDELWAHVDLPTPAGMKPATVPAKAAPAAKPAAISDDDMPELYDSAG